MSLQTATKEQLLEAERIAIKYSPNAVMLITKAYLYKLYREGSK